VAEADAFLSALAPEDRPGGAERERRESERRESERRDAVRREARVLADKERALERAEAERERERSRELARLREEVRRRQRDLERDLREESASDSDAEPPLSPAAAAEARSRKRYFRRRADERARVERRRLRLREVEEDEAEQRRAALEARDAARKAAEPAKGHKPATSLAQPADGAPPPPPPGPPPNSAPAPAPAPLVGLGLLRRPPAKKAAVAGSGLLTEAEEAPCSRTLVPLQYTEEELRAALVNEYEAAPEAPADAPQEAGVTHSGRREDKEARRRREREEKEARKSLMDLIEAIPTDRATLFAYAVDWDQFDRAGLRATVQRWVAKKVAELLGEAEPSLVEFITAQVAAHVQPEALLTELLAVLDDEAEAFVIKLWRMVIFELKRESHHHT
jgi:RNA-binding protein 25